MTHQSDSKADSPGTDSTKIRRTYPAEGLVRNIRVGKRSTAVTISTKILESAGFRPGVRLDVEVCEDGSLILRPEKGTRLQSNDAEFDQCVAEVLSTHHELLSRLAK